MNVQHAEMLFMMLRAANTEIARLGDINIAEHIKPTWFLQMPSLESLEALDDAAKHFRDGDNSPDGDLLLQVARIFTPDELGNGLIAGGQLVDGYKFSYPRRVGARIMSGWCGYATLGVGYARCLEVAVAVCATSLAAAKEEEAASLAAQAKEEEQD